MLQCRFCGAKSEPEYLYLLCKHISCISCAFLRADFASQTIQCCGKSTTINESSLQKIITSKRHLKNGSKISQFSPEQDKSNEYTTIFKQIDSKCKQQGKQEAQIFSPNSLLKQLKQSDFMQSTTNKNNRQDYAYELQNLLIKQIEKIRKQFQMERQMLKQKEENCIKDLLLQYEEEIKNIEKPIGKVKLQKFTNLFAKQKVNQPLSQRQKVERNQNQPIVENSQKSRDSYDHILKRLEVNQQRMKQKIQKHLEVTN